MDKRGRIVLTALVIGLVIGALTFIYNVEAAPKKCNNGIDDDGDGLIDYPADHGCNNKGDNNERGTLQCDNGIDDDSDTFIDYPSDTGCSSATDNTEAISNSCSDSDGGFNQIIQGTASGYANEFPYSSTDFCIINSNGSINNLLHEFWCSGTIVIETEFTCGTSGNLTGICSNGKCI
ncbi:MAG TPA: hypothetical protein VJJ23_04220 [Candidatus Nanoarchaeia archaeon]|nr:hypothetical protein [Candidatus Nanoarchaeia archaeon]